MSLQNSPVVKILIILSVCPFQFSAKNVYAEKVMRKSARKYGEEKQKGKIKAKFDFSVVLQYLLLGNPECTLSSFLLGFSTESTVFALMCADFLIVGGTQRAEKYPHENIIIVTNSIIIHIICQRTANPYTAASIPACFVFGVHPTTLCTGSRGGEREDGGRERESQEGLGSSALVKYVYTREERWWWCGCWK